MLTQNAPTNAVSYLAGTLHGDAWCSDETIGLHVKDKDFADTFAVALELVSGCVARPRRDGAYWRVTARNDSGRFAGLRTFEPTTDTDAAAWLRGLFDSEGNAQLRRKPQAGPECWGRRVAIYSTDLATLERARRYLQQLTIPNTIRPQRASVSHLGTRQVYELSLMQDRETFLRFAWLVGSSIQRKREVLFGLPLSYRVDPGASMRAAQRKGAEAKHRNTMEVTLPSVVAGVRNLIRAGIKPTQRNCRQVPGFASVQRYVSQSKLVEMASAS